MSTPQIIQPQDQAQRLRRAARSAHGKRRRVVLRVGVVGTGSSTGSSTLAKSLCRELQDSGRVARLLGKPEVGRLGSLLKSQPQADSLVVDFGSADVSPVDIAAIHSLDWVILGGRCRREDLIAAYAFLKRTYTTQHQLQDAFPWADLPTDLTASPSQNQLASPQAAANLPQLAAITLQCERNQSSTAQQMRNRLAISAKRFLSLSLYDFGEIPRFPLATAVTDSRWPQLIRALIARMTTVANPSCSENRRDAA